MVSSETDVTLSWLFKDASHTDLLNDESGHSRKINYNGTLLLSKTTLQFFLVFINHLYNNSQAIIKELRLRTYNPPKPVVDTH